MAFVFKFGEDDNNRWHLGLGSFFTWKNNHLHKQRLLLDKLKRFSPADRQIVLGKICDNLNEYEVQMIRELATQLAGEPSRYSFVPNYQSSHKACLAIKRCENCPICLQELKDPTEVSVVSPCGHVFCTACISVWTENNQTCPLCRRETDVVHGFGGRALAEMRDILGIKQVSKTPPGFERTNGLWYLIRTMFTGHRELS